MDEMCTRVREKAKEYWQTPVDKRTIMFRWLEEHVEHCQACSTAIQDVAEEIFEDRRL